MLCPADTWIFKPHSNPPGFAVHLLHLDDLSWLQFQPCPAPVQAEGMAWQQVAGGFAGEAGGSQA